MDKPPQIIVLYSDSGLTTIVRNSPTVSALEQKTSIGSAYDEFFQGYGAEIRLSHPDFHSNSTYKRTSTPRGGCESAPLPNRFNHADRRYNRTRLGGNTSDIGF